MRTRIRTILLSISLCTMGGIAQGQVPCPGYNPNNNKNLACEIATATRTSGQASSLGSLSPTLAAQLSQLPIATAVTGTGLTFSKSLGVFTASLDSLGTILTQRGETIGKHKFFVSFSYQRFIFKSIDGVTLKDMPIVNFIDFGTVGTSYVTGKSAIDLRVDQLAAVGSFGLTDRIDVSVVVPYSRVKLKTVSTAHQYNFGAQQSDFDMGTTSLPGAARGFGDVTANVKVNLLKGERTSIAAGNEIRFPTGDEMNYLGTGAYGIKPYIVLSRRGRLTPNVNFGYQWNGGSALLPNSENLPSSLMYSGGADFRVVKRFTITSEFMGQYVLDGSRIGLGTRVVPGLGSQPTVAPFKGSYAMHNLGVGFKLNPIWRLILTFNALIKLDDGGLRSKFVPLAGISYRF